MVAVIFDPLLKTLKTAETLDDIEALRCVTQIYGVVRIEYGTPSLSSRGHWVKGLDRNGVQVCLISNVEVLEHVF
jgi:hypothetical protein